MQDAVIEFKKIALADYEQRKAACRTFGELMEELEKADRQRRFDNPKLADTFKEEQMLLFNEDISRVSIKNQIDVKTVAEIFQKTWEDYSKKASDNLSKIVSK